MSCSEEDGIQDVDRLIHEPNRLQIMAQLYGVQRVGFLFLQNQTRLTPGNLSVHLSKLQAANYLEVPKGFIDKKPHTLSL